MAVESAVAFYERLEHDKELLERVKTLETPEKIESYVKGELGYDFTREEMQQVIFERHPEVSDEELEVVVGGLDAGWYVLAGAGGGAVAFVLIAAGAAAA